MTTPVTPPGIVKKLEWVPGPESSDMEIAKSCFGESWVWEIQGSAFLAPGMLPGRFCGATLEAAKAAAQADYERRVLSALDPAFLKRVERMEEALHDLLSWFPKNPAPSEWRLLAGEDGADDAIAAARAALSTNPEEAGGLHNG